MTGRKEMFITPETLETREPTPYVGVSDIARQQGAGYILSGISQNSSWWALSRTGLGPSEMLHEPLATKESSPAPVGGHERDAPFQYAGA